MMENPQKVGVYERGGHVFWSIFVNMALNPPNHNENLFRTYELLMLADIHVGFRPFLKNIFSTEVRSRGHFSSPSEAIPYQYTEGQRYCSKNRPKIKKKSIGVKIDFDLSEFSSKNYDQIMKRGLL